MSSPLLRWRVRSAAGGIAVALATTLVAVLLRGGVGVLAPGTFPFAPFILAVLVTALVSGYEAGLLAILLGLLAAWFFLFEPDAALVSAQNVASSILYVLVALAVTWVSEALRMEFDRKTASEQRYRQLFDAMSEAYVVHDIIYDEDGKPIDFRAIEANPAFELHTGMPRDIVVGHLASEFAPGGDPEWLRFFAEVVRTGRPDRIERFSRRPQRWVDLRAFPLGGPRLGIVFNDVSQRKRAEAEREAAEARLAAAMQLAEVGAFEYDPESSIVMSWGSCNAIYGFAEAMPSRPLSDYLARIEGDDAARLQAELERARGARTGFGFEHQIQTDDGSIKWIAWRGAAVTDPRGETRIVGAVFDITARKLTELRQQAVREQTEILFREMNHRTKNNLSIVASMLHLQSSANKGDPNLRHHLDAARERIITIAELHTSLYQGNILGEIDFGDYIRRLCTHIESSLLSSERGILLMVEAEQVSLPADIAIPVGLVVNELVTNAIKHAFEGVTGGASITVAMARRNDELLLSVADNGRGLPECWSSARNGLGSRIVEAFVKQVRGRLSVAETAGTRFDIVIPAWRP